VISEKGLGVLAGTMPPAKEPIAETMVPVLQKVFARIRS
jgi:hypothetical protein